MSAGPVQLGLWDGFHAWFADLLKRWRRPAPRTSTAATLGAVGTNAEGLTVVRAPCCTRDIPLRAWFDHACSRPVVELRTEPRAVAQVFAGRKP